MCVCVCVDLFLFFQKRYIHIIYEWLYVVGGVVGSDKHGL
jgi:hypothetical protein